MASSPQKKVHPEIVKYNIKPGDYLAISPYGWLGDIRYFLINEVTENRIIIHPGDRHEKKYILEVGLSKDEWIFSSYISGGITYWSRAEDPEDITAPITFNCEIESKASDAFDPEKNSQRHGSKTNHITVIYQNDPNRTDYKVFKEGLVEIAMKQESESDLSYTNFKVPEKHRRYGYDMNIIFKAKTQLGAIVTYKNWLDSCDVPIGRWSDDYMWDQHKQYEYHINYWITLENMIPTLVAGSRFYVEKTTDNIEDYKVVDFPGTNNLVKSASKT